MRALVTIIDDNENVKGEYELNPIDKYYNGVSNTYIFKFAFSELDYNKKETESIYD